MLNVTIPETEMFDSTKNEFFSVKETNLCLEHSLVSVSKWEAKWHKAFLEPNYVMTNKEQLSYIQCMTINKNVDENVYKAIPNDVLRQIINYINDPHTATTITHNTNRAPSKKKTTNEEIYYMMFQYGIPMECQKWHFNRLLTLLEVFNAKNGNQKKMSNAEIFRQNTALNAARRAQLHSKG